MAGLVLIELLVHKNTLTWGILGFNHLFLSRSDIFFVLSSVFSTFGHLLSLVPTTDFKHTSVSLLNYGLLSIGKYVIKNGLDPVFYHAGAPSLMGEAGICINNLTIWHAITGQ